MKKIIIDYEKTIEQAINDGNYDWKNKNVNSNNFPMPIGIVGGIVEIETKLFQFNKTLRSNEVIIEMQKSGYRPAILIELLALGKKFPELQRQFPIMALGSIWKNALGQVEVPYLDVFGGKRGLHLTWIGFQWISCYRFLGVYNQSLTLEISLAAS